MSKAKTLAQTVSTGGSVATTNGGTGQTGFTTGDILYSSATDTLSKLAVGSSGQVLKVTAGVPAWATDSTGTGTVTSASVVSANGFAGTVATATTTPAITVSTSITGVLKGDGTAISAATAGTDYLAPPSGTAILKANSSGALANATAGTDYVAPGGALGTPSSGTATNLTGLPLSSGVTGTLPVANGGTGSATLTANNVLLGNGTSALQAIAPSTSGNVLTSNGTTWASTAPAGGGFSNFQVFTSSGTFTVPSGVTKCLVYCTGGGGGGDQSQSGSAQGLSGGGAGGTAIKTFTLAGGTAAVTIGAGGASAPGVTSSGGTGGASTFVYGTTITGSGGAGCGFSQQEGGTGGGASGGDLNLTGGCGNGASNASGASNGVMGGAGFWGGGSMSGTGPYGSGGSGRKTGNTGGQAGVVVIYY